LNKKLKNTLINQNIKALKVRIISIEGDDLGIVDRSAALTMAKDAGLDLVQLSETDGLPLVKIMDFGKNLYAKKKKMSEGKKKQKVVKIKEIKLRPKIGDHDYQTKLNRAIKFLGDGNKVKVTLVFRRGREAFKKNEQGAILFERVDQTFADAELQSIAQERDMISMTLWSRIYYLKSK
jgi:translation initiation factor IF-3